MHDMNGSTRDIIVKTAAKLFFQRSYVAVGVNEICQEANIPKGSFYHFFKSKDDVVIAVIDYNWNYLRKHFRECLDSNKSTHQKIRDMLDIFYRIAINSYNETGQVAGCPIGNLAMELSTTDTAVRQRISKVYEDAINGFRYILTNAVDKEEISVDTNVERLSEQLLILVEGASNLGKTFNDPEKIRQSIDFGLTQLLDNRRRT